VNHRRTIVITLMLVSAWRVSAAQTPAAPNTARGRAVFMNAGCYTCHGTVGQGGAGARLAPKPRPQAAFMAYVRSGRRGWSVAGGMPAYPVSLLSDAALAEIYAYLMSIPAPPSASEIALLKD
jgi:ubiquinol-cytochrome c reductase cytochrome c subunit